MHRYIKVTALNGQVVRVNIDNIATYYQRSDISNITYIYMVGGGVVRTRLSPDEVDRRIMAARQS